MKETSEGIKQSLDNWLKHPNNASLDFNQFTKIKIKRIACSNMKYCDQRTILSKLL